MESVGGGSMDFYHSWIYRYVLDTEWLMWTVVWIVIAVNLLAPVIAWFFLVFNRSRKNKRRMQARTRNPQS